MSDLTFLPRPVMAQQIRERKISPVELVDAHLAKIERLNPKLNAFVHVDAERARHHARRAEATVVSGNNLGPLHGVPISIKSSLDVAGFRCEAGTRLRSGHVATQDAPLVSRLRMLAQSCWALLILGVIVAWETDNLLWPHQQPLGS
jgi:Asp-tRNA(Asn)/Glu-tRNA(Gln) amidotransferase A subunit family amidase